MDRLLLLLAGLIFLAGCEKHVSDSKGSKIFDSNGKEFVFKEYQGKYIIVNYWALWCKPCIDEIPELVKFQNDHNQEAIVLGVGSEHFANYDLKNFKQKFKINYPLIFSDPSIKIGISQPQMYPTSVMINKRGKIIKVKVGSVSESYLEQLMHDNP